MSASMNRKLLEIVKLFYFIAVFRLFTNVIAYIADENEEYFLCRQCGREITKMTDLINTGSKQAIRQRNDTFGPQKEVLIQLFKNPHGVHFEVISSTAADVFRASEEIASDTWFPGTNWRIIGCPGCRQHIGWEYIPKDKEDKTQKSFFGLILANLLYQNDADSLLLIPKSYTS